MLRNKLVLILLGIIVSGTMMSTVNASAEEVKQIMTPSYVIIPRLMTPSISPGEVIQIDMYISGYGVIKQNKILVSYSSNLIDKNNPGTVSSNVKVLQNSQGNDDIIIGKNAEELTRQDIETSHGQIVVVSPHYFIEEVLSDQSRPPQPHELPTVEGEINREDVSPIRYRINSNPDATAGDYKIDFVLTFSDGKQVQSDHKVVEVHVKSLTERIGGFEVILGMIFGAFATLQIILTYSIQRKKIPR